MTKLLSAALCLNATSVSAETAADAGESFFESPAAATGSAQISVARQAPVVRLAIDAPASGTEAVRVLVRPPQTTLTLLGRPGADSFVFGKAVDALGLPVDLRRARLMADERKHQVSRGQLPAFLPVRSRQLTSGFGLRTNPVIGYRALHAGVDFAAPIGTPIVATSQGTVGVAGWSGGYGLLVTLDHGNGVQTRYGHMSGLNVVAGQKVSVGDIIGYVGSTGRSTGPHVHYEVRVGGRPVDPLAPRPQR